MAWAGELIINLKQATDLRNCDKNKDQDPYVILKIGSQKCKSKTHKNGGSNPVWNENLCLLVNDDDFLHLKLMDKDPFWDDLIGECWVPLATVRTKGFEDVTAPVVYKNRVHGSLHLALTFKSLSGKPQQLQRPQQQSGIWQQGAKAAITLLVPLAGAAAAVVSGITSQ